MNLNKGLAKGLVRISFILLLLVAFGFFVFNFVLPALATHTTSVSVSPQYVAGGSTDTFIFTVTNNGADSIYKITINIPAGSAFSINPATISCPSGWTKDVSSDSSKAVCITDPFGGNVLTNGNSASISFNATAPVPSSDTEYTWNVVTKDINSGYEFTNTEAKTTVDVTPPTGDVEDESTTWVNSDTVKITCSDASSGCKPTAYYKFDEDGTCPTKDDTWTAVTLIDNQYELTINTDHNDYLCVYVEDNVGYSDYGVSSQLMVDATKPTSVITSPNAGSWQKSDFSVNITDSDTGGSELNYCEYQVKSGGTGNWVTTKDWTRRDCSKPVILSVGLDKDCNVQGKDMCKINVRAIDNAGNSNWEVPWTDRVFSIDWTASTVGEINVEPSIDGYTGKNPIITATITDEGGSGVASCEYTINNGTSWQSATWNGTHCIANPTGLTDGQTYQFNIKGIDNAGNEGVGTAEERTVDATSPTILNPEVKCTEGDNCSIVSGENTFVRGLITVYATVEDQTSGVKEVIFTIGSESCTGTSSSNSEYSCKINTTKLTDGSYTLNIVATDNADNNASNNQISLIIDNTPPTTTKNVDSPKYPESGENEGQYVTNQTQITLTANDAGIGVEKVCYKINNGEEICSESNVDTISFTFTEESEHNLTFWAVDKLGNTEQVHTQTHYVDNSPPITTKSYGTPYYAREESIENVKGIKIKLEWITSNTPISLNAVDCGNAENCTLHPVGVKETKYRYCLCENYTEGEGCPGNWSTYSDSEPFTIPQESCHVIEYYSVDNLGNTEEIKYQQVFVDNTPPVLTKEVGEPYYCDEYTGNNCTGNEWITQNTSIYLSCYDPEPHPSNNVKIWYRYYFCGEEPHGDWILYPIDTIYFPQDSCHKLEYYCEDALGNSDGVHTQTYIVDTVPPVTTKSYDGPHYSNGTNEWITSDTLINLTAVDCGDSTNYPENCTLHPVGVKETKYRYCLCENYTEGEGCPDDWSTYSEPFRINEESCHVIEYYSVDNLGNKETTKSQTVFVDNTPPVLTKVVGEPKIETEYQLYITNATPINLTCQDQQPHPVNNVKIWYRYWIDETLVQNWTEYTSTIYFPEDSYHYLEYYCEDALGNSDGTHTQVLAVDITPPNSTTTSPVTATAEANEIQVEFSVCWTGEDNKVGIEKFDLWVKDGENPWVKWTPSNVYDNCANYLGTIGHTYCFKSRAKDYLGNYEDDKNVGGDGVSCTDVAAYSFNIHLIQGWNLISLPVVPINRSTPAVLKDISNSTKGVWTYDPLDPNAIEGWLTYNPEEPETSNLKTMTAGFGYWIEMLNGETLTVVGSLMAPGITPPQRTLVPGWNLIGYYGVDGYKDYPTCYWYDEYGTCLSWCEKPPCYAGKETYCALYSLVNTYTEMPRWTSLWGYYGGSFYELYTWYWGGDRMDPGAGYWIALGSDLPQVMYTMSDCPEWW